MRKSIIIGLLVFPSVSSASDPSELIPYAIGYLGFIWIVIFMGIRLLTRSLPNNWSRFYIRVLAAPVVLSILFLILGLEVVSIAILAIAFVYIQLYKFFCKWING